MLLRVYIIGESMWSGYLSSDVGHEEKPIIFEDIPTCHLVRVGLILHYKKIMAGYENLTLNITYRPNSFLDEASEVSAKFFLER